MNMKKIRALIVDDSAFIRLLLTEILNSDPDIEVVGVATDPYDAREKIKKTNPDVLTLDIEMPKMDGLTFLSNLMRLRPIPVVMISTLTSKGADVTLKALELGAFDFICKPKVDIKSELTEYSRDIIEKVKAAAHSTIQTHSSPSGIPSPRLEKANKLYDVIAIGASTGGTEAIKEVICHLPNNLPPIVIAQHIPDVFSTSYAQRLNSLTKINVIEVRHTQEMESGFAYIAPGDDHLLVSKNGGSLYASIEKSELVNRHRPSVDVLFNSVADTVGKKSIGIILTGMGNDGAKGLLSIKDRGGITFAQDQQSSVVWGMPGSAYQMGAVTKLLPLNKIAQAIVRIMSSND